MGNLNYKAFSKRRRPHIQPIGATLFVTFRLFGSIPKSIVVEYEAKNRWLENQLNRAQTSVESEGAAELRNWLTRVETFRRAWFVKFEDILHRAETGPTWLRNEMLAQKVADNLKRLDRESYRLDAYSIMSNHVHIVFKPLMPERDRQSIDDRTLHKSALARIMQSIKGRSARECNLILERSGAFWEQESFDHVIRPGKFGKTVRYVLNNPVKAGLVLDWRQWQWNYCRKELVESLRL
jgi:putative transposase